jgi:hypothetical protein
MMLGGRKIIVSPLLPTMAPKRQIAEKPWHRNRIYVGRVNKKWRKRYGMVKDIECMQGIDAIFVSAEVMSRLRKELENGILDMIVK